MSEYGDIKHQIDEEMTQDEYNLEDTKITHVENLFIISYLTKAIQDILIRRVRFFQYPLLLVDLPLALAILIVNVERILYVKILGYVLAHIQYDVSVLKGLIFSRGGEDGNTSEGWAEWLFDFVRKILRFVWGLLILMLILPIWPLIWIYNYMVQTILIAIIYYFLMFVDYGFVGGFLLYYLLLATVVFLVSSITVPFIFQLSIYIKEIFSLERKTWKQVHKDAKMAFVKFYQKLHGAQSRPMTEIKTRYSKQHEAEGGVYYMLLKFLHFMKDKFWEMKKKRVGAVVDKIQKKTVEYVDEYYEEKKSYYMTIRSLSSKDLKRTVVALVITIVFAVLLVLEGSHGKGLIGPVLLSFVDEPVSEQIWANYNGSGRGYYEDMVFFYGFLPNFLKYLAIGADTFFEFFFQSYYVLYPLYIDFIIRYYAVYFNLFLTGFFYGG